MVLAPETTSSYLVRKYRRRSRSYRCVLLSCDVTINVFLNSSVLSSRIWFLHLILLTDLTVFRPSSNSWTSEITYFPASVPSSPDPKPLVFVCPQHLLSFLVVLSPWQTNSILLLRMWGGKGMCTPWIKLNIYVTNQMCKYWRDAQQKDHQLG